MWAVILNNWDGFNTPLRLLDRPVQELEFHIPSLEYGEVLVSSSWPTHGKV
jgi:hypothetical protein